MRPGRTPTSTWPIVSVPGEYAALEAHHALTAGLHVLLFSDGVALEEEIELKERAAELGLLVMGPGAGTAVLGGTGLGFANVVPHRPMGPGSAGSGSLPQPAPGRKRCRRCWTGGGPGSLRSWAWAGATCPSRWVGGWRSLAVRALDDDPATGRGAGGLQATLARRSGRASASTVPALPLPSQSSWAHGPRATPVAQTVRTLEDGALAALRWSVGTSRAPRPGWRRRWQQRRRGWPPHRTAVRGLFSGGTLCYEAQLILEQLLGEVYSNEPLREQHGLPAPDGAHVLLDLGAEEYTRGVPHPMIEPSGRLALLREQSKDPDVAVVLIDVVLGHGSHVDPAGQLAPVCAAVMADGGPQVVAYVLGTEGDPQVYSRQRATLEEAGCLVPETNARAAYAAGALALRKPELAAAGL